MIIFIVLVWFVCGGLACRFCFLFLLVAGLEWYISRAIAQLIKIFLHLLPLSHLWFFLKAQQFFIRLSHCYLFVYRTHIHLLEYQSLVVRLLSKLILEWCRLFWNLSLLIHCTFHFVRILLALTFRNLVLDRFALFVTMLENVPLIVRQSRELLLHHLIVLFLSHLKLRAHSTLKLSLVDDLPLTKNVLHLVQFTLQLNNLENTSST